MRELIAGFAPSIPLRARVADASMRATAAGGRAAKITTIKTT